MPSWPNSINALQPPDLSILRCKVPVRHGEIYNAFYEGDYERNHGNSEQIVQNPLTNFAKVKLVNPDTTEEKGK